MANSVASYDQLAHQVEALRKENFHLRRELEDNSNHLSKLENETSDMKDVLRQLQSKLEQEAGTLASSGRADVLDQLKELHMDLTNYYELKHQPHNLHVLSDTLSCLASQSDGGMETTLSSRLERTKGLLRPLALQSSNLSGDDTIMHPGHLHILEGAPPKKATIGGEYHITAQYLEELRKERTLLLSEIDKEERERCWYYTQLRGLSQRLAELPCIDTFSLQMDLIRQQLEFEAQQVRSVMVQRFGSSDEMVHRTQIRVARLEQLEKKLQEAQECQSPQDNGLLEPPIFNCEKTSNPDAENASFAPAVEASGDRGSKVEMVFWLLSMLANRDKEEMTQTLLAMSSSQDNCIAMRKSGCVPLLVQILHNIPAASEEALRGAGCNREVKSRASAALHNIIYSQPDEGQARREMRVLHLLEQISSHCDSGREWIEGHVGKLSPGGTKTTDIPEPLDPLICQAMCGIMKLSFEEEYRRAMNELGGLQVVAELMYLDQEMYGMQNDPINMALRRYAGMALTNLTFGDVFNKATLCSKKDCLQAIVAQLASDSEELHQVVSSILRNLSWRADINSKTVLRDIGSVSGLITCALQATKESTLKSLLSALWNLSAHSVENKVAVCSVDGALGFLVSTLTYRCQTNSLAIIESGGGILRNVSSLVATREDYRQILRDHNCLQTLLQHLRSHSLTIVSNACGTLWNLSAQNAKDQELLWDLGAVSMLRNLIHSKHKMIAMGSAAALRNLITNRPLKYKDTAVISPGSCMPSLYMRKQKALEAELDAKNLTETFDSLEKLSPKHLSIKKPLRHIESLAKDYASDSGCFDDDEAPNVCGSLDTGSFSMLSMFLSNSNLLQNQPCKKDNEPERDVVLLQTMGNCPTSTDDVSAAADKLAKKITNTVAKIDKLVEDITMHTSSEDSFSLSSEDPFADWPYGSGELHEARAKSCSPFHFSDTSSFAHKDQLSRAHALLRLKTAHISLSTDSLNSGSTSDGYCGSKDQIQPSAKAVAMQSRPNKLNLKVAHQEYLNGDALVLQETNQTEVPKKDSINGEVILSEANSTETEKYQELQPQTPASVSTKLSSDVSMTSVKLSPSYTHVPLSQSVDKLSAAKTSISAQAPQAMKRQAWVPPGGSDLKCSLMSSAKSPILGPMETLQKYSVENTPICFSRCSSLSSLSSGEGALDGHSHSEYELESDLSLEIIEVDDSEVLNREEESETKDDLRCDEQPPVTDSRTNRSAPIEIPCTLKHEKTFLRAGSPSILEDKSPSSSSENYLQETPLVMSRCSSVSSLGSFESPSIASSILSDQCSGIISGTLSPSDLPDSPGQTMPPSRSKTPCCVESSGPDPQTTVIAGQWESSLCKFMEIADFKERFNIPPDLDTMIYFTVEKPTENFSCASSLSALPLHEHYIQKDVELKLTPLQQQKDNDAEFPDDKDHPSVMDQGGRYSEGNSDEDIEILKECINSAMPSKFRKARPSMMSTLQTHVLSCQSRNPVHVPMYMMFPNNGKQMCTKVVLPQKDNQLDDSSFTDSAEGTPINLSSTTSLSDETLQYSVRDKGAKDWAVGNITKQELLNDEAKRIEDLRIFSHFHKPPKITSRHDMLAGTTGRSIKHVIPTQKVLMQSKEVTDRVVNQRNCDQSSFEQRQKLALTRKLQLPDRKQNTEGKQNQRAPQRHVAPESICHITPTEGTIYCFCDEDRGKKQGNTKRTERPLNNDSNRDNVSQSMTNISRFDNSQLRHKVVNKVRQNLIKDDTPLCYSLSSSLSSLSDADLKDHKSKSLKVWTKNKHNQASNKVQQTKPMHIYDRYGGHSSPSSVSMDSEDDLLQKCITSAMPKQKKKLSARKKKTEKNQKKNLQKVSEGWNTEQGCDSDDMASDVDSDLNSVEWRAIQEGANSVVNRLQASKSEENSSEESESVLSFMSGSSFTPKEKKFSVDKKANKPLDFAPRKPVPNMPMVFRGRTVIYTPKKEIVLSQRPQPIKMSSKTDAPKNPNLAQHRSKSLHRLGKPQEIELSLPKRSSTPPPRIPKSSSSGSSQSSTPSRQSQRKLTSPSRSIKAIAQKSANPASISSERKGRSLVSSNQSLKSQAHKTQKSPVRISFMQNSTRSRTVSPLVNDQPTNKNRQHTQVPEKRNVPANRYNMVRMTSVQSNSSESDHNGLLRQLTFIKESKSLLKRNGSSPRSMATQQQGSSMRTCPGASAVFLCSSRCQELKAVVQAPRRMQGKCHEAQQEEKGKTVSLAKTTSSEHTLNAQRSSRRTSSESPCRVPQRNISGRVSGDKQQDKDTFKRHSSSPSLNLLSRVTSRSSLRSSSSDSSGRTKSEDDTKKRQQRTGTHLKDKVTWRRIRDEDEPQTLKNALPPTALPLFVSGEQPKGNHPALPGKLPTLLLQSRKTSDATVQTEDFLTNKTLSSISTSADPALVLSEEAARLALLRKISNATGGTLQDGEFDCSIKSYSTASTANSHPVESHTGGVGCFRQSSPSRAVRVTPFNYIPSPMGGQLQDKHSQSLTINKNSNENTEA